MLPKRRSPRFCTPARTSKPSTIFVEACEDYEACQRALAEPLLKDYATEFPPEYEQGHTAGLRMLRVAAAIRDERRRNWERAVELYKTEMTARRGFARRPIRSLDRARTAGAGGDENDRRHEHQQQDGFVHAGVYNTRHEVPPEIAADIGVDINPARGVDDHPQIRCPHHPRAVDHRNIRFPDEPPGIQAHEQMGHGRIAGHHTGHQIIQANTLSSGQGSHQVIDIMDNAILKLVKGLMFLGSGSVIHAMSNEQDMDKMGGLAKHMPVTAATMGIATLLDDPEPEPPQVEASTPSRMPRLDLVALGLVLLSAMALGLWWVSPSRRASQQDATASRALSEALTVVVLPWRRRPKSTVFRSNRRLGRGS